MSKEIEEIEETGPVENLSKEDQDYEVQELDNTEGKKFSFNDIMADLSKPKQPQNNRSMDADPFEDEGGVFNEDEVEPEEEGQKSPNAKRNAELICKAIDNLGAFAFSLFAQEKNSDFFKMKQSELKMLMEETENTLGELPDFKMPPYIGLLIVLPVIYIPKIKLARELRKVNEEKTAQQTKTQPSQYSPEQMEILKKRREENNQPKFTKVEDAQIISEKDQFDLKKEQIIQATGVCERDGCNNPTKNNAKTCSRSCNMKLQQQKRWKNE
jgi:hypothetical protein